MYLLGKPLQKVHASDIIRLKENKVSETKSLEYKSELNIDRSKDKKEFLADVSAMANTEGGCLVIGITEEIDETGKRTGIPGSFPGIAYDSFDEFKQRIENLVGDGIQPRIGMAFREIEIDGANIVLIGIRKSSGLPHMITLERTNKFYRRNNTGKYLVDVFELNSMFNHGKEIIESAKGFINYRIEKIQSGEIPRSVRTKHFGCLHIIPLNYMSETALDFSNSQIVDEIKLRLRLFERQTGEYAYNMDGLMLHGFLKTGGVCDSYCQLFRNASVEFYTSKMMHFDGVTNVPHPKGRVAGTYFETNLIGTLQDLWAAFKSLSISPPFLLNFTMFNVENFSIYAPDVVYDLYEEKKFGLKRVNVHPIVIEDLEQIPEISLKPLLDSFWQAGGYPKSPHYSGDGTRLRK